MDSILVTGIGGVVGQGILRNLRAEFDNIRIIGCNTSFLSAGNHLCDEVIEVSRGDADGYIDEISEIIKDRSIKLIIASTDLETFTLSKNRANLKTEIAVSAADTTDFCLDKWKTYMRFSDVDVPFARSFLPSMYSHDFAEFILKPRAGRGSRSIYINPEDWQGFSDEYVIQELHRGPEITTTFYVTRSGDLHGFITMERSLEAGNTSSAEVTQEYDDELANIIKQLISNFDFRGSVNLQSIVTDQGIVPFEVNCRISGTNSLRSAFGFKDVKYTVQEYLLDQEPDTPIITTGCALRMYTDVIYPGKSLREIKNNQDEFFQF